MKITRQQAQSIYDAIASTISLAKFGTTPAAALPGIDMAIIFKNRKTLEVEQVTNQVGSILANIK